MKRILLAFSLLAAMTVHGQILNVTSIERLDAPGEKDQVSQAVAISPKGDYLLLSTDTKQGLVKWDLNTGQTQIITTDEGTGSNVLISNDGKMVVYSQVSYKDKRRHEAVQAFDLTKGKRQTLLKPSRKLQGVDIQGTTAAVMNDGQLKTHALNGNAKSLSRPMLSHHHLKLYVTTGGETKLLAPNGTEEHYIWASLSPDGKRVLYYVSGKGTFVCDVDGSNVISMGNLTAPKWLNNNIIVGMDETDGEYTIIASRIIARTLDGVQQVLTEDDIIATYPLPSAQSGKIVFSTPDGQIYLITIE